MRGIDTMLFLRSSIIDAWFVGAVIGKTGVSYAHIFALRNGLILPYGFPQSILVVSMVLALGLGLLFTDWRGLMVRGGWQYLLTWRAEFDVHRLPWNSERFATVRAFVLQLGRYMTVGGLTTLLDFLLLNALLVLVPATQAFQINLYSTATYVTSLVIGYAWHRWWTFRSAERPKAAFGRFIILNGVTFAINTLSAMGLMVVLPSLLAVDLAVAANFSKALATLLSGTLNFLGQRVWVFRATPTSEASEEYRPCVEHDA